MDAWEILISNSTISPDHDAWEHLNAQGGGGGPTYCVLREGIELSLETVCYELEIEFQEYQIEIGQAFEILVDFDEYELEVC